ncbi:McrB family protein [Metabacillus sp. 113a]|uniref:McrB family protein n=1 Tax=Metabacillus sp. 113a TaxID=3404706 RepID=UPI003CED8159
MYGSKYDIDFAGVLLEEGQTYTGRRTVWVNTQESVQYHIRIISITPENFPRQIETVTGYGDSLTRYGFEDDLSLSRVERANAAREFLSQYILFFTIDKKSSATSSGVQEFHKARNIRLVKKSDAYREDISLIPIPIYSEIEDMNKSTFEHRLLNSKYVGENTQISREDDDTPTMILWSESTTNHTLYGLFSKHDYARGGFKFFADHNQPKNMTLDMDIFYESYQNEQVLFMDSVIYSELQQQLEEGGEVLNSTMEGEGEQVEEQPVEETEGTKEYEFMVTFKRKCVESGLFYSEKDLYNFHASMKTGGLVILSGMSGTGKTKLVQCYMDSLGLQSDQRLFVPVRPSWQDDTDLLGYLDTMHNIYQPGDSGLVNFLIEAEKSFSTALHIVCFDEMNLARVEHYFSQFLSVLELEENKRFLPLYNEDAVSRTYNSNFFGPKVKIGPNVVFVGTVNLDESTYHFSDKVLDRANVITLNMIPYLEAMESDDTATHDGPKNTEKRDPLSYDVYRDFRKKERKISLTEEEASFLWELHKELQACSRNLGIGWRIVRQISLFLLNLPAEAPLSRQEGFDIQVVQRILTKIRGSEEQFTELLGRYNSETKEVENSRFFQLIEEFLPQDSVQSNSYSMVRTREAIREKAKELRLYGHTV